MKLLAISLALFGVVALTAMGQQSSAVNSSRSNIKNNIEVVSGPDGKVWCTSSASPKPTACTQSQVALLNKALGGIFDTKGGKPKNSGIKSITLAKDGSLICATNSGTGPCTTAHLPDLKQAIHTNELENYSPAAPQK